MAPYSNVTLMNHQSSPEERAKQRARFLLRRCAPLGYGGLETGKGCARRRDPSSGCVGDGHIVLKQNVIRSNKVVLRL
jgi:hypothetical protein